MNKQILIILLSILSTGIFATTVVVRGFDFEGADFSKSIEEKKVIPLYNEYKSVPNQVVVGQSQGGLTSIGYAQMMKERRNNNVKAVITVDSPIVGFAGLDYGYPVLRSRLIGAVRVHDQAISAIGGLLHPALASLISSFSTESKGNLILELMGDMPMKPLLSKAINKTKADSSMTEIMDMSRTSSFVKKNVRETKIEKRKKFSHYEYRTYIKWKKGWFGIPYPVVVVQKIAKYKFYDHYYVASNAHTKISKIGHIVGTDNDPLRMTGSAEGDIRTVLRGVEAGYNLVGGLLKLRYLIEPWNWYLSDRCFKAASWTKNYKAEWGNIIGGRSNDGFITTGSQTIPGRPSYTYKIDHKRSCPPELQANKKDFVKSADAKTNHVYYGNNSLVSKMKKQLGVSSY